MLPSGQSFKFQVTRLILAQLETQEIKVVQIWADKGYKRVQVTVYCFLWTYWKLLQCQAKVMSTQHDAK